MTGVNVICTPIHPVVAAIGEVYSVLYTLYSCKPAHIYNCVAVGGLAYTQPTLLIFILVVYLCKEVCISPMHAVDSGPSAKAIIVGQTMTHHNLPVVTLKSKAVGGHLALTTHTRVPVAE